MPRSISTRDLHAVHQHMLGFGHPALRSRALAA